MAIFKVGFEVDVCMSIVGSGWVGFSTFALPLGQFKVDPYIRCES